MQDKKFVKIYFDVRCKWRAFPPSYRIFVNDEMFAERTYSVREGKFIREILQVNARPGVYKFRIEELSPITGEFSISNPRVEVGDARILPRNRFEIL